MVLFIKGSNDIDITKLCRLMVNIEKNKNLYNMDGTLNITKTANKSFNKYIHNQIEFDATVSCGFLILYVDKVDMIEFIKKLNNNFNDNFNKVDDSYYPFCVQNYNSTQHTAILKKHNGYTTASVLNIQNHSRYLTNNMSIIQTILNCGVRFVWYIHHATEHLPYIQIQELCTSVPNKMYLMRAMSTIIYDSIDIFKVKPNLKQINYPSINQLTQNLQPIKIQISMMYGLDYEIMSHWIGYIDKYPLLCVSCKKCNFTYKTCKVNEKITFYKQLRQELSKPFNLEEYNQSELRTDICFITRSPLYGTVYILEFNRIPALNLNVVADVDTVFPTNNIPGGLDKCYITINAYTMNLLYENMTLPNYLFKKYKILVVNKYISTYERTELMAINMIPDDSISKVKKNIMRCVSKNGACIDDRMYKFKKIFTYDIENNIIYIGVPGVVYAITLHKFKNTNTVIFGWDN
jgi:hypothetical protein